MGINFDDLKATERYSFGTYHDAAVVAHDDDRWIVPVVAAARNEGRVKTPTLLVSLDRHHDACDLRRGLGAIPTIRRNDYPPAELLSLVDSHLGSQDDDWIKAGMELGLFSDAIIWGVDPDGPPAPSLKPYIDHLGQSHQIFIESELPGGQLGFQGSLSDVARRHELKPYWDSLGWVSMGDKWGFEEHMRCVLNIDFDCFTIPWNEFVWLWPDEVWEARFNGPSNYRPTIGMTSGGVLRELLQHASLITMAREPEFTGGRTNGERIEEKLRRLLFEDELRLPPRSG